MAQSPRHLLGPHALSTIKEIKPLRSSNDYFPDRPMSHAYHVYTNILASQFLSGFTIADFDMFQTHPFIRSGNGEADNQGAFHASLRALGNGPVTVTDSPGRCVEKVFMRLVGRGKDGRTIALNSKHPLEVLDERCFDNVAKQGDGRGLRGYSVNEFGVVMGIWNVRENSGWVKDSVSIEDVATIFNSKRIACWSHVRQDVFLLQSDPGTELILKALDFDIFTLVEMTDDVMCLGLIDKYNTLSAIHSRHGNIWNFKSLGDAVWVIPSDAMAVVKIDGKEISSLSWKVDGITIVRVNLTGAETNETGEFWTVELIIL